MSTNKIPAALAVTAALALGAVALAGPAQASTGPAHKRVPTAVPHSGVALPGKALAATAAPALAAVGPKGYVIVNSGSLASPAGTQVHGSATCPTGKVPLGGGVYYYSSSLAAGVNSSYPTSTGWGADVNNGSAAASTFTVYAICGKAPKKYAIVTGTATAVNPGAQLDGIAATCASGKPLSGGLFSDTTSLLANVNSSLPSTTSWRIDADNGSAAVEHVTPYVVCGKVGTYHVVTGPALVNGAGLQTGSTASCGTGVPIGGGAFANSGSTLVFLNASFPISGGWQTYMNNGSSSAETVTTYAVCSG